jgi:hypothetical protein
MVSPIWRIVARRYHQGRLRYDEASVGLTELDIVVDWYDQIRESALLTAQIIRQGGDETHPSK